MVQLGARVGVMCQGQFAACSSSSSACLLLGDSPLPAQLAAEACLLLAEWINRSTRRSYFCFMREKPALAIITIRVAVPRAVAANHSMTGKGEAHGGWPTSRCLRRGPMCRPQRRAPRSSPRSNGRSHRRRLGPDQPDRPKRPSFRPKTSSTQARARFCARPLRRSASRVW